MYIYFICRHYETNDYYIVVETLKEYLYETAFLISKRLDYQYYFDINNKETLNFILDLVK